MRKYGAQIFLKSFITTLRLLTAQLSSYMNGMMTNLFLFGVLFLIHTILSVRRSHGTVCIKTDKIKIEPLPNEELNDVPEVLKDFIENSSVDYNCLPDMIAKNYGMISMVDHNIGRVVHELEKQNLLDNTIIVFFSDHGDYMGDHGLMRKALIPYDGVYRVPTIWRIPEKTKIIGTTDALHSTVDIMPTILELAGVNIPDTVQGVSQVKVLLGETENARDLVYAEYDDTKTFQRLRYVRDGSTMLAYFYGCDYGMLYDIKNDPGQQKKSFL